MFVLWLVVFVGTIVVWRTTNRLNSELVRRAECDDYAIRKRMAWELAAQGIVFFILLVVSFSGMAMTIVK